MGGRGGQVGVVAVRMRPRTGREVGVVAIRVRTGPGREVGVVAIRGQRSWDGSGPRRQIRIVPVGVELRVQVRIVAVGGEDWNQNGGRGGGCAAQNKVQNNADDDEDSDHNEGNPGRLVHLPIESSINVRPPLRRVYTYRLVICRNVSSTVSK